MVPYVREDAPEMSRHCPMNSSVEGVVTESLREDDRAWMIFGRLNSLLVCFSPHTAGSNLVLW
jgi:hypothetical protein